MLDVHLAPFPDSVHLEGPTLDSIHLSPTKVKDILSTLKLGKASIPNNVDNRILKDATEPLSNPLCDLSYDSMSECVCPNLWKEANVSPLYKKDDPSFASNYRPVSLLSKSIGNGKIIHKYIFKYFNANQEITC